MRTTHRDAHIYIFPHWIMRFVSENEQMENISEDIIGWWAKAGWQTGLSEKLGMNKLLETPDVPAAKTEWAEGEDRESQDEGDSQEPAGHAADQPNASGKTHGQENDGRAEERGLGSVPPVLAYVHPSSSEPAAPLIRRVDTARLLLAVSLQLAKLPSIEEVGPEAASPFAHARKVAYPEGVKARTTITKQDSLVAENVTVQEKTSIKESVVGANCQINEGAKLSQCLLMDGVVVGKNCKLTRCILGKRSAVGEGSTLTDCEVQENLLVEPKSKSLSSLPSLPFLKRGKREKKKLRYKIHVLT